MHTYLNIYIYTLTYPYTQSFSMNHIIWFLGPSRCQLASDRWRALCEIPGLRGNGPKFPGEHGGLRLRCWSWSGFARFEYDMWMLRKNIGLQDIWQFLHHFLGVLKKLDAQYWKFSTSVVPLVLRFWPLPMYPCILKHTSLVKNPCIFMYFMYFVAAFSQFTYDALILGDGHTGCLSIWVGYHIFGISSLSPSYTHL